MNNISAGLSASDGNQLVCDSCGVNLPTPTPNTELELEKLEEESMALIQTEKNGIEIRLILTKCDCGSSKLAIGNEAKDFESKLEVNDRKEPEENSKADFLEPIDESIATIEVEPELESNAIDVFESSDKFDEFEVNVFKFWSKNWRQFTSVLSGLLLLLTLGVHNVFTIYEMDHFWQTLKSRPLLNATKNYRLSTGPFRHFTPTEYASYRYTFINSPWEDAANSSLRDVVRPTKGISSSLIVIMMWFVGAIVGNILGAEFIPRMKKRTLYYYAALLQIVAGISFVLLRFEEYTAYLPLTRISYESLKLNPFTLGVAARLVSGIACGLVQLTVTVHASDIASKRMRRVISYTITMITAFSTVFYAAVHQHWYFWHKSLVSALTSFDYNMVALGLLTLLLIPLLTNETVPYYLLRGKVAKAQKKFAKLNNERGNICSSETLEKFDELQLMVQEDKQNGRNIFGGGNFKPLFTVLCARTLLLILMNVPIVTLMMATMQDLHLSFNSLDGGYLTELSAARIVIGIISLTLAACLGRHKFFYILTIVMVMGSILGIILLSQIRILQSISVLAIWATLSLGLDYYQQKQSMDAFTVTKKPWSLATIALFEHMGYAAMIILNFHYSLLVSIVIFVGIVVIPIILLVIVPETRKLSLRETRNKFNSAVAAIKSSAA